MNTGYPRLVKGFTLMEMLLVLGIIALLLGMGTYMMINIIPDAEVAKVKGDITALEVTLTRYKTNNSAYPTVEQGLSALAAKPVAGPVPRNYKPLLREQALVDPWGRPYQYRLPGKHNPEFDVFSLGPDGVEGTEDDVGNW
jgi:general secretion pathway protein G